MVLPLLGVIPLYGEALSLRGTIVVKRLPYIAAIARIVAWARLLAVFTPPNIETV
jgi:hypothetical protein